MEPRIPTLLDDSPYSKRLTLDPSLLTNSSSNLTRHIEPTGSVQAPRPSPDSHSNHDRNDTRTSISSQVHSGAPLARVLNDPASSSHALHLPSGRQTPQHATFRDGHFPSPSTISPDALNREDHYSSAGYSGGDVSLIQLPKPPQVPRKTAKRPRIPPLLQGLHQPPPLPPKNRLFPPITSDRSALGSDVGDRFSLGNTFPIGSAEELARVRVPLQKETEDESNDTQHVVHVNSGSNDTEEQISRKDSPTHPPPPIQSSSLVHDKVKASRKRTRWTQKETEDLLIGVSRFGIGKWKKILECEDFQFQGRTAVDLKDRFRVCRPGEGLKARKVAPPEASTTSKQKKDELSVVALPSPGAQLSLSDGRRVSVEQEPVSESAPSKTQVYGPFLKSKRRERREFSEEDDKNLLKGFKRYGPVWHKMRDDFELGFGMRHPTDLRDRFRIRYPELFAQAGRKLKLKEEQALKDRKEKKNAEEELAAMQSVAGASRTMDGGDKPATRVSLSTIVKTTSTAAHAPIITTSKPTSTRPIFDLSTDLTFDDDDDDQSPIVLNRNILQWADENSASATSSSTNNQLPILTTNDILFNPFTATSDGLHINPLATLKLSSTVPWNHTNLSTVVTPPSLPPPGPLKHSLSASTANTSASRAQQEMRTPNLPNIVFPYVPHASARNAVHNLPAPADILSSGQTGSSDGYVWIG
ncbi:hypothetical protein E8E13_006380 [Curvularia kusanoi]|uniref:Uncharacterized protein n=1 Tax=Curvularia kusanoi TaxID=90978 RepID=A0A9P4T7Y9_CURKU|nr:hypothetical protein E8E13_006380 [Curvularia kusanoi]